MLTWLELANFINHEMPECNRGEEASVWDASTGKFYPVTSITPYSDTQESCEENFYSVNVDTTHWW